MNLMIRSMKAAWQARSARERGMLAAMALLIATMAVWLLVMRPAWTWRASAAERRAEAVADTGRLDAGLGRRARVTPAVMRQEDLEQAASRAAEATDLAVSVSADGDSRLAFDASGVSSAALFGWLATLKTDYGVETTDMTVVENADATLDARGTLGG
ncbi:General secretion pathway, M protein [compost metagenome]